MNTTIYKIQDLTELVESLGMMLVVYQRQLIDKCLD